MSHSLTSRKGCFYMLKIKEEYPPNIDKIRNELATDADTLFCYFPYLYAPFLKNREIPKDLLIHEEVHAERQEEYTSPEIWWYRYLYDQEFRLEEELEAYTAQYSWVKKLVNAKAAKQCLEEVSEHLASNLYNLGITKYQAETLIRKHEKRNKSI